MALAALQDQVTGAVDRLSESVVGITSTRIARHQRYGLVPVEGQGSGVLLDSSGHIVTNYHVIDEAAGVEVHLRDGRSLEGHFVGGDPQTDIAVIRIDRDGLPPAKLGDSEHLRVGQFVLAIGNSLGLPGGPTVTVGVVSALNRPLPGADFILDGLIQTDAAVNPGNSGGPLADIDGNVVGITTAMMPFAQGVGFAIPIHAVQRIVGEVLEKGRVVRPWLGVYLADASSMTARWNGFARDSGVIIVDLVSGGPAEEAGLRAGDIIVGVEGLEVRNSRDLLSGLAKKPPGSDATLDILRTGVRRQAVLRLEEAPVVTLERRRR